MPYRLLVDAIVVLHFAFLLFVVAGGFLARRNRWWLLLHVPAMIWAVYVEAMPGVICPLTPLENRFAELAGGAGYQGDFVTHYLLSVIYPEGLTRGLQWMLAGTVVVINALVYAWPRARVAARRRLR